MNIQPQSSCFHTGSCCCVWRPSGGGSQDELLAPDCLKASGHGRMSSTRSLNHLRCGGSKPLTMSSLCCRSTNLRWRCEMIPTPPCSSISVDPASFLHVGSKVSNWEGENSAGTKPFFLMCPHYINYSFVNHSVKGETSNILFLFQKSWLWNFTRETLNTLHSSNSQSPSVYSLNKTSAQSSTLYISIRWNVCFILPSSIHSLTTGASTRKLVEGLYSKKFLFLFFCTFIICKN